MVWFAPVAGPMSPTGVQATQGFSKVAVSFVVDDARRPFARETDCYVANKIRAVFVPDIRASLPRPLQNQVKWQSKKRPLESCYICATHVLNSTRYQIEKEITHILLESYSRPYSAVGGTASPLVVRSKQNRNLPLAERSNAEK
jgi:hypothetical protein